jgi:hypothetical protein
MHRELFLARLNGPGPAKIGEVAMYSLPARGRLRGHRAGAWRVYDVANARQFLAQAGTDVDAIGPAVEGKFASAFVRARKPAAG